MKYQIRNGLFETNSSSVHAFTMCSDSEFNKWKNGELVYYDFKQELISVTDSDYLEWKEKYDKKIEKPENYDDWYPYLTYEQFFNLWEYETFESHYTTPKGEEIVAFGYYGHD